MKASENKVAAGNDATPACGSPTTGAALAKRRSLKESVKNCQIDQFSRERFGQTNPEEIEIRCQAS